MTLKNISLSLSPTNMASGNADLIFQRPSVFSKMPDRFVVKINESGIRMSLPHPHLCHGDTGDRARSQII